MGTTSLYFSVISGRAGTWAWPMRGILGLASVGYERVIRRRNRRFDSGCRDIYRPPVPTISVGNLTTGGTGKTPLVIDLAGRLGRLKRQPAIVSRGYRSGGRDLGDELTMISNRLPGVPCVANPDRKQGICDAIKMGADVIILDDGFQHRGVARDWDIVTIDATNPFGYGRLLPAGMLREPPDSLQRADLLVLTRCDQVSENELESLGLKLQRLAPDVPRVGCRHRVVGIVDTSGQPMTRPLGLVIAFAAIGNPMAFKATLDNMNLRVAHWLSWPDHHRYRLRDVDRIATLRHKVEHDVLLTTAKDAANLEGLDLSRLQPLGIVEVELAFADNANERLFDECLIGAMGVSEPAVPIA